MRLDQAIAQRFPEISRRKARDLLVGRRVLVNERPVSIASREVSAVDRIAIVEASPEIPILAITDGMIAVDKPTGIAVQPTRDRAQPSVEELLRLLLKQRGERPELYLVHRLDTGTSGVVVFARNRQSAATLSAFFRHGAMRKRYLAVVSGSIDQEMTIESPIGGKAASTNLVPLAQRERTTLLAVEINTGRTHQIRIHLASIGHPVVGDRRYGGTKSDRLLLHAWKLEHESIGTIVADPPAAFGHIAAHEGPASIDP